jgi:hypothetical protein
VNNQPKVALLGDKIIGNVSSYAALPSVKCPSCGSKLHRVYNTQTKWAFVCLSEKLLVAPGTDDPPVQVQVE